MRDDVEPHQLGSSVVGSSRPGTSASRTVPAARSTSGTRAATNGTNRMPALVRISSRSCPGRWSTSATRPTSVAAGVQHPQPDQLAVVVLLVVPGRSRRRRRRPPARCRAGVSTAVRSGSPGSGRSSRPLWSRADSTVRTRAAALAPQHAPGGEAALGLVGADVDRHLAPDAVGSADDADDTSTVSSGQRRHLTRRPRSAPTRRAAAGRCACPRRRSRPGPVAPASAPTTVRSAVAVRPERPMTLPMSYGLTRTSSIRPWRSSLSRTRTSSGCETMPRTRCSSASSSTIRPRWAPGRQASATPASAAA